MARWLNRPMDQSTDHLREKRVELILQQLEGIPALSPAAAAVVGAAAGNASAIADAVTLASDDAAFSNRLLQLLQACGVGQPGEFDSVDRVITRRGFELLRQAAMSVGAFDASATAPRPQEASPFNRDEYWKHAVAVGCCAQLLAEQM